MFVSENIPPLHLVCETAEGFHRKVCFGICLADEIISAVISKKEEEDGPRYRFIWSVHEAIPVTEKTPIESLMDSMSRSNPQASGLNSQARPSHFFTTSSSCRCLISMHPSFAASFATSFLAFGTLCPDALGWVFVFAVWTLPLLVFACLLSFALLSCFPVQLTVPQPLQPLFG